VTYGVPGVGLAVGVLDGRGDSQPSAVIPGT
jgi:hypothetical protein